MKLKRKQVNFLINLGFCVVRCLTKNSSSDTFINHRFIKEGVNILEKRTSIYDNKHQIQKTKYYRTNPQKINKIKKYVSSMSFNDFRIENYINGYSELDKETQEMITYLILIYLHQYGKLKKFLGQLANILENKEPSNIINILEAISNKDISKLNKDIYYFAVDFDYRNFLILNK